MTMMSYIRAKFRKITKNILVHDKIFIALFKTENQTEAKKDASQRTHANNKGMLLEFVM